MPEDMMGLRDWIEAKLASITQVSDERNLKYEATFVAVAKASEIALAAQEKAVAAALAAAEKAVNAAFEASEKAIVKAEDAQKQINNSSNEFRQALNDSNLSKIGRPEFSLIIDAMNHQVEELKTTINHNKEEEVRAIQELRAERTRIMDTFKDDVTNRIGDLKDSRNIQTGHEEQRVSGRLQSNWLFGAILGGLGLLIGIIEFILRSTGK